MINTVTGIIGGVYTEQYIASSLSSVPITSSVHIGVIKVPVVSNFIYHKVLMASPLCTLKAQNSTNIIITITLLQMK